MQFWVQDIKPKWLPEDFQVPSEMTSQVNQLLQQAENAYYHVDLERNGFLRRREFKKAMKKLGVNKFEAKHMLILVDQERLKVVSIKNYVNAYLFIKCGGLNHINIDYQGPITTGVDKRDHLRDIESKLVTIDFQTFSNHYSSAKVTPSFITQNLFQAIPRGPRGIEVWLLINLKASNGMYLCSENGKVVANRPVASIWEQFYFLNQSDWGNGFLRVLRTYWNTYLTCEMNNTVNDNRTAMGPWEKFDTVSGAGSGFAFKSWTGYYLSADASGNVSFASSLGPNETWQMTILAVSP